MRRPNVKVCLCSKILQDYSLEEAAKIAARIGYDGMEVFGLPQHLPADTPDARQKSLRALFDGLNLKTVTICSYLGRFEQMGDDEAARQVEDFKRYVEIANRLGSDMVRLIAQNAPLSQMRGDHFMRWAHWAGVCADYAKPFGVRVLLENHQPLFATVEWTMKIVALMGRENVGIDYDPINLFVWDAPEMYGAEAVRRFGRLILNVQVKDARKENGKTNTRLLLGEGVIDWRSILSDLKKIGYAGYFSAECEHKQDADMTSVDIARREYQGIRHMSAALE